MADFYAALLEFLHTTPQGSNWIKLSGLPARSGLLDIVVTRFGGLVWKREIPNFYLELKPTWEEFKGALSRNIKESLRKCYNAPKRDGVAFEFAVVSEPAHVDAAVDDFLRLHGERATRTDGVIHPNVFKATASQTFLREVCHRFSAQGRLRIFQIKHEGRVIATRIGFLSGDCLYLYYSGYDQAFAKYSVMTTLVAEAIQFAIGQKLLTVNLSTGRDVSKERWGPRETLYEEIEVVSGMPFGRLKYKLFKFAVRQFQGNLVSRWVGRRLA
jgi:CelD/BcsL family acetyltransferase involved in cellulose biosynthesis